MSAEQSTVPIDLSMQETFGHVGTSTTGMHAKDAACDTHMDGKKNPQANINKSLKKLGLTKEVGLRVGPKECSGPDPAAIIIQNKLPDLSQMQELDKLEHNDYHLQIEENTSDVMVVEDQGGEIMENQRLAVSPTQEEESWVVEDAVPLRA
ncbi:hypothetical protein HAX54_041362 [Datura stramonium]|uniref:Uncharacterized protein n=1 Tax=Datura stramonium TaxID=4076 RepID=A0ABS8VUD0_DATST|nr:hypothetical protein [Datura stramonium]